MLQAPSRGASPTEPFHQRAANEVFLVVADAMDGRREVLRERPDLLHRLATASWPVALSRARGSARVVEHFWCSFSLLEQLPRGRSLR